ncbi:hypothetical protein I6I07_16750 [Achromobacter deleyi]|uniref:Lipoprotein n=1 Tax=Achromobacter deleyi TaxID=1353891 RepID=A0A7T4AYF3_9BURK|nr:hypothetical protein [Achromobacter deleyi]QQB32341.1 hypothetical protein I6I07_16750 [Achromobacter deleyi]
MRYTLMLACVAAATLTSACSSRQAYDSGQAWQRNECGRIADTQERQRCMGSASSTSYDSYQRQRQDIQK